MQSCFEPNGLHFRCGKLTLCLSASEILFDHACGSIWSSLAFCAERNLLLFLAAWVGAGGRLATLTSKAGRVHIPLQKLVRSNTFVETRFEHQEETLVASNLVYLPCSRSRFMDSLRPSSLFLASRKCAGLQNGLPNVSETVRVWGMHNACVFAHLV